LTEFANLTDPVPARRNLSYRWGAAFEALRADAPPGHVFLATLGPVSEHTPRAGFAANLLAAGGIAVDAAGATSGVDDLTSAYDGQQVACIAGTAAACTEWGSAAASALRAAGAQRVVVAGPPADWADDCFRSGDDAIAFLTRIREALR
jgi:methylmalonyl-CoA mutase